MKSMPYTVPDGFFEEAASKAAEAAGKIRSRRRMAVTCSALVLAAALLFINRTGLSGIPDSYAYNPDEEILDLYEHDIFLNNFQ